MTWIAGVDGCKAGWVVVRLELDSRSIAIDVVDGISVVLDSENPPEILCIDVPIGLLDEAVPWGARVRQKRRENFLEALVRVASFRLQHARLSRAEASRKRFV